MANIKTALTGGQQTTTKEQGYRREAETQGLFGMRLIKYAMLRKRGKTEQEAYDIVKPTEEEYGDDE